MNDTERRLLAAVEARQGELYEILSSLIKVDSQDFGAHGLEQAMVAPLCEAAEALGLSADVYSPLDIEGFCNLPDYMEGRNLENRPNVTIVMPGSEAGEGVHLMAHTDTVEVGDLSAWTRPPHSGEIADGRVYGRGACDDKYGIATVLYLMRLIRELGITPRRSITFTGYSDEEHGGSHGAMAGVIRYPHRRILNLDCKGFDIWSCAAGGGNVKLDFAMNTPQDTALAATSLLPIIMEECEKFGARRRAELSADPNYEGTKIHEGAMRYMEVKCGSGGADLGAGYVWFQYYTNKTTEEMDAEINEMMAMINARLAPLGALCTGWERNTRSFHYGFVPKDADTIRELQVAAERATGRVLTPVGACLSDLSVLLRYGSPVAISFGIGRDFNAEGGAHQPNEFIECADLLEFAKIIAAYLCDVAL